ncbi:MAG: protease modulator HflC [Treponema sp.]|jgi:membrane protease subunit HflC|nr:protease modulator HflC [Treponema sp.]
MKKNIKRIIVGLIIFIIFITTGPFFIINEGEQAVVVRFGKIVRTITDAGLKVKIPLIDTVHRYTKKIIAWDGEARTILTAERQLIFVDVVARWKINDLKVFYESIGNITTAHNKLGEIIDSEVKTVVAENPLRESVRNSNIILERTTSEELSLGDDIEAEIITSLQTESNIEAITRGRRRLAEEILDRSRRMVPEYGIELIDVVTRQISYSDELTPSVYARMIRERNQIAQAYRSAGEGSKAEWLGKMDNDKRSLLSAAYERAETIKGEADAKAARIYADAYNLTADRRSFYDFWRATESYRQTMSKFDKTLTTDMDYFRYLYSTDGRRR